jgi:ATP-dependent HslUV protease ATP-binding subunit HslU
MIRDLVESAIDMVRTEREAEVEDLAVERVDERILDLLLPAASAAPAPADVPAAVGANGEMRGDASDRLGAANGAAGTVGAAGADGVDDPWRRTRDRLRQLLIDGQLEQREVELEVAVRAPRPDMTAQNGGAPGGLRRPRPAAARGAAPSAPRSAASRSARRAASSSTRSSTS